MAELVDADPLSPLPAATVVLLRDASGGLEVFLLNRHGLSDVLGGSYVFPGGKMDQRDAGVVQRFRPPLKLLHEALGEPELSETQAAAFFVTAIREVFEETGVLFAELVGAGARQ